MCGRLTFLVAILASLIWATSSASGEADRAAAAADATPTITVTAGKPTEHAFKFSATSVRRGTVIFKVVNRGKVAHGFEINGHSTRLLRPRTSTMLRVIFKRPGKYVYQCVVSYGTSDDVPDAGPESVTNTAECASGVFKVT